MSSSLGNIKTSVDTIIANGIQVAPIHLIYWQTDPNQYTVGCLDAYDSDGLGIDLLYHYAFSPTSDTAMYTHERIPFEGYDLEFRMRYAMGDSSTGNVHWTLCLDSVSNDTAKNPVTTWAEWDADDENAYTIVHTPSSVGRTYTELKFTIPSSAYSVGDTLKFALKRSGAHADDTRSGYALVEDVIDLVPVLP